MISMMYRLDKYNNITSKGQQKLFPQKSHSYSQFDGIKARKVWREKKAQIASLGCVNQSELEEKEIIQVLLQHSLQV